MKYYKTSEVLQDGEDTFFSILVSTKDLDGIVSEGSQGYVTTENGQIGLVDLIEEVTKEEYKEFRKKYKTLRDIGEVEGSYFIRD